MVPMHCPVSMAVGLTPQSDSDDAAAHAGLDDPYFQQELDSAHTTSKSGVAAAAKPAKSKKKKDAATSNEV